MRLRIHRAIRCCLVLGWYALGVFSGSETANGESRTIPASTADGAIDRGLVFLVKDARDWKAKFNCVSCHHASLVVWSLREAKLRGRSVDEPALAGLTRWVAESGEGKTGSPRPASAPKAHNTKALHYALALAAEPNSDPRYRDGLKLLLKTVKGDQLPDGSWSSWPETRAPIFGNSDDTTTAMAVLSLLPAAASGDASAKAVRDKGVHWLASTKTDDDAQSIALRVVLGRRLGRPSEEWQPLIARIIHRQNGDGGWSQTKEMPSDAWATGQALYALASAGIKPGDPVPSRARAFLVKTQRSDGSWPMSSRPVKPGGAGAKSLVPITCAGTAWAVIGLSRSR